jgi:hypothetical protein
MEVRREDNRQNRGGDNPGPGWLDDEARDFYTAMLVELGEIAHVAADELPESLHEQARVFFWKKYRWGPLESFLNDYLQATDWLADETEAERRLRVYGEVWPYASLRNTKAPSKLMKALGGKEAERQRAVLFDTREAWWGSLRDYPPPE